jgi:hypothetical protein
LYRTLIFYHISFIVMPGILLCRTARLSRSIFFPTLARDGWFRRRDGIQTFGAYDGHLFRRGVFRLCRNCGCRRFFHGDLLAGMRFPTYFENASVRE